MTATDKDSGSNAELTYTVSNDNFVIETRRDNITGKYIGDLRVAKYVNFLDRKQIAISDLNPHDGIYKHLFNIY